LQRALGQAVAALHAIEDDINTVKHARGAAREALGIIDQTVNLWDLES
jgi:hypothetical protein